MEARAYLQLSRGEYEALARNTGSSLHGRATLEKTNIADETFPADAVDAMAGKDDGDEDWCLMHAENHSPERSTARPDTRVRSQDVQTPGLTGVRPFVVQRTVQTDQGQR